MLKPALASPVNVFTRLTPLAVAENTISKRSPALTLIAKLLAVLATAVSIEIVLGNARATVTPVALKVLLFPIARYISA